MNLFFLNHELPANPGERATGRVVRRDRRPTAGGALTGRARGRLRVPSRRAGVIHGETTGRFEQKFFVPGHRAVLPGAIDIRRRHVRCRRETTRLSLVYTGLSHSYTGVNRNGTYIRYPVWTAYPGDSHSEKRNAEANGMWSGRAETNVSKSQMPGTAGNSATTKLSRRPTIFGKVRNRNA